MAYQIRALDAAVDTAVFRCGSEPLDEYIRCYASQDVRKNIARVFIATPADKPQQLAGFFTLSAGSVEFSSLPEKWARKLPRYPVPVALMGRLAVDLKFQGKGLVNSAYCDACHKIKQASSVLAVAGVIVDAKDDGATSFYEHFGFILLPGQKKRMLLPASAFLQG